MARNLTTQCIVVVVERKMSAAAHHGATALVGDDLQSVTGQLQRAHDLGAQQAAHVGAVRVSEILVEPAAYRSATDIGIALEYENVEASARQITGRNQSVMARADDDGVMPSATFVARTHARD